MMIWLGKAGITAKEPAVTPTSPNLGGDGARTTLRGQPRIATLYHCSFSFMLMYLKDDSVYTRLLTHPSAPRHPMAQGKIEGVICLQWSLGIFPSDLFEMCIVEGSAKSSIECKRNRP